MLTHTLRLSPPCRSGSSHRGASAQEVPQETVCLSSAAERSKGPGIGTLLASVSALAITLAPQATQAAEQAFSDIELVLGTHRSSVQNTDPLLDHKWQTPDQTQGNNGGERYHFEAGVMDRVAARHLTADQLPEGAPRLTARGVDPNQSSKVYLEAGKGHMLSEPFKECTQFASDGSCTEAKWDIVQYVNLSCVYKDESTGELMRVLHRSTSTNETKPMDRSVCAGHRLIKENKWSYQPLQTDPAGNTLYLNPLHIIKMEPVQK